MGGQLRGKVALVTGASRGIGRATALAFGREGACVAVNYFRSAESAFQVVEDIGRLGSEAVALQADVARPGDVSSLFDATLRRFGKLDILVNNAAVMSSGSLETITEPDLDAMLAVNLKGVIHCCQAAAAHMIRRRYGKIVNLSSIAALGTAVRGTTPYATTKAAVLALTKRLALELGPHGINVNAVCPGFIRTDMALATIPAGQADARIAELAARAMLGRIGEPEDVAAAVLFLASDAARFITAQALTVDGGRMDLLSHGA